MTTMRAQLVSALSIHMKGMAESEAKLLAQVLTMRINVALSGKCSVQTREEGLLTCFPPETWNHLTVGVPWESFGRAHGMLGEEMDVSTVKAVCSTPAVLDESMTSVVTNTGLWGGSLLVSLGQMLAETRRELVVFSPYWRVEGVKSLLAAVGRARYDDVSIVVYTQSANRIAAEDQQGVRCFKNLLQIAGAKVAILSPKTINGASPFIHAKLMIADGVRAYVGSANFTSSGLDYSIESGVMVEGEVARSFCKWAQALSASCSLWPDGH